MKDFDDLTADEKYDEFKFRKDSCDTVKTLTRNLLFDDRYCLFPTWFLKDGIEKEDNKGKFIILKYCRNEKGNKIMGRDCPYSRDSEEISLRDDNKTSLINYRQELIQEIKMIKLSKMSDKDYILENMQWILDWINGFYFIKGICDGNF